MVSTIVWKTSFIEVAGINAASSVHCIAYQGLDFLPTQCSWEPIIKIMGWLMARG